MVIISVTVAAAITDCWKFKVYNVLTFPALLGGLLASTALGGWPGLTTALLGAALGFAFLAPFFAVGGVGAGDVKLLMAVGSWVGPYLVYRVFVASALLAGLYAVALLLLRGGPMLLAATMLLGSAPGGGRLFGASPGLSVEVARPDRRRRLVPYAAMICVGFGLTLWWWWRDLHAIWPPYGRPVVPDIRIASRP